jgi:hypothetical protein
MQHFKKSVAGIAKNSDHFVFTDSFHQLERIKESGINLAILKRQVNSNLADFISSLDLTIFPEIQTSFYYYECEQILTVLLRHITTDKDGLNLWISDIARVTQNYCLITKQEIARFRLQVVDSEMCKYFHCDYNNLRLLTTYRGNGTIWCPNHNVDRDALGCQNNKKIVTNPSEINELETFWIGIFKGELFMNNSGNGIVHRSPNISGKNKSRILLRLDA